MKFSDKRFLVTGGAGFIGSSLVRELINRESDVTVLDDFSVGKKANVPGECDLIEFDVSSRDWMSKVSNVDYILHFGAPSSVMLFKQSLNKCVTDTILGMINVLEYSKLYHVKKVVFPSSSSVYGNTPLPQSESTPTSPINIYGVAKLTCEYMAQLYADTVPNVGLRIFAGYGPGEGHKGSIASVVSLFMNDLKAGIQPIIFGDGSQSRDFVYIDDIVQSALNCISNDFTGIVNVGSGESHNFVEVIGLMNSVLGTSIQPRYVEKPAHYFERTRAEVTKMEKTLDVHPTSLEVGLIKYINGDSRVLEQ
ncbi:MAG: NAD-dependent epimerase/dehydratase family protein [Candidatus Bathyarchaeia archaeon]|jgi:UDP-glucose 4-epimerase